MTVWLWDAQGPVCGAAGVTDDEKRARKLARESLLSTGASEVLVEQALTALDAATLIYGYARTGRGWRGHRTPGGVLPGAGSQPRTRYARGPLPVPDENAPLPLRAVPGIPRRQAGWNPYTRIALHSFETMLRMLPDTRSAAGSPRSRDYDRIIAAMFRVLERCYRDAAPYAPPGGNHPPCFPAGGPSGTYPSAAVSGTPLYPGTRRRSQWNSTQDEPHI